MSSSSSLRPAVALQSLELMLDAATLQVLLLSIGVHAAPTAVFAA
jgi:hypothetical protein